jgi:2,3-bisphosphoglycerate-dependent phosphoglycerate mutase
MYRKLVFGVALLAFVLLPAIAAAQALVLVTRHAERADEPARDQDDPQLSALGHQRAARLAAMLKDAGVDAIYVTRFQRTQETAAPLAAELKIRPEITTEPIDQLVQTIRTQHPRDVILIVGHSNTIPDLVKALGGAAVELSESDYSSLFVVAPTTGTTVRIRY